MRGIYIDCYDNYLFFNVEGGDYILVNRGKEGGNRDYASYSCNKLLFYLLFVIQEILNALLKRSRSYHYRMKVHVHGILIKTDLHFNE